MKKFSCIALAVSLALSLLAGCSPSSAPPAAPAASGAPSSGTPAAPGKVYEIKLVTSNPSTDPTVELFYKYAEEIKNRTNGGVEIQVYPGGEILMGDEGIEAIMSNAAVITFNDLDVLADYVPEFNSLCASFLVDGHETIEKLTQTDIYRQIMEKADAANVHVITGDFVMGARNILAGGVEIYSVADAPKLNIRIPNVASYVAAFDAFHANYSAIGWGDGVTACETGMLNGAECVSQRALTSGLYEILDNPVYSMIQWRNAPVGLEIGNGYWTSLPQEYRDIITEEFSKCAVENNDLLAAAEDGYVQQLKDAGVKVIPYEDIDIDTFKEAVRPLNEAMPMFSEVSAAVSEIMAAG